MREWNVQAELGGIVTLSATYPTKTQALKSYRSACRLACHGALEADSVGIDGETYLLSDIQPERKA